MIDRKKQNLDLSYTNGNWDINVNRKKSFK